MNYNKEINELGLGSKLLEIAEEDKASSADYVELENKIKLKTMDNEQMMFLSGIYVQSLNEKPKQKRKNTRKF